jgi:hypothetical protein
MPVTRVPQRATQETVATVISWAIFGAGIQWSRETVAMSAETMADQVVAVITEGATDCAHVLLAR